MSYLIDMLSIGMNFQIVIMNEDAESHSGMDEDDDDGTVIASIKTFEHRNAANLFINKNWGEFPTRVRTNSLVHEALHIIHKPLDVVFADYIEGADLPIRMQGQADHQFTRAAEKMVDQLAYVLAPLLEPYGYEYDIHPNVVTEGNDQ
jgi:hypothetical protein